MGTGVIVSLLCAVLAVPVLAEAGGWYLQWPGPSGERWETLKAFDSAATCERSRQDYIHGSEEFALTLREPRTEVDPLAPQERIARAMKEARCIATDDPRLRSGTDAVYYWMSATNLKDILGPDERWQVVRTFVTMEACEGAREVALSDLTRPGKALLQNVVALVQFSRCVASADPRLRSSPGRFAVEKEPPGVAAGGTTMRYTPGQRILIDVWLNGRASARLMLDTGADRTIINARSLIAAGADLERPVGRGEMRGVTGRAEVPYVVVDSLEIGQARVHRLPVAVYETAAGQWDGLLGRDFLDRFGVSIDPSQGIITLSPK